MSSALLCLKLVQNIDSVFSGDQGNNPFLPEPTGEASAFFCLLVTRFFPPRIFVNMLPLLNLRKNGSVGSEENQIQADPGYSGTVGALEPVFTDGFTVRLHDSSLRGR